jgi:hypothetical protein
MEREIAFHEHWTIIVHRNLRHTVLLHKMCSGLLIRYRLRHKFQEAREYAGEKPNLARPGRLHNAAGTRAVAGFADLCGIRGELHFAGVAELVDARDLKSAAGQRTP